jgi:formate hydrogenlyase subunit 3/multisubunit Na+/H+ antiporter MnhD subunit
MLKIIIEITGWIAAALMLSAYLLLTMGKITGRSSLYQWLNVLSGAGFILNSGWNGAYPSAFINVVWVAIGLYGVSGRPKVELGASSP